ncbi:MAG TPA: hypothetical protein VGE74_29000 [Gemmata sp.]
MSAELFDRRSGLQYVEAPRPVEPAFAARPRLLALRNTLTRATKQLKPDRWNEPAVFFFDPKRQTELESARPPVAPDRFAELTRAITTELPHLFEHVEVRRVARALDGFRTAALQLAPHCSAARDLADLLAVPDDEVFLVLAPADRTGVKVHVRGAASVGQFCRLLEELLPVARPHESGSEKQRPSEPGATSVAPRALTRAGEGDGIPFQLFAPAALSADATLPAGVGGCGHWLWPAQPLSVAPRIGGERVVLLGPAVIHQTDSANRFPELPAAADVVEVLNAFQVAEALSRLTGRPVSAGGSSEARPVARAA